MTVESRLRDALHHEADLVEPRETNWEAVADQLAARRRARRVRVGIVAGAAAAAAGIAGLAVSDRTTDESVRVIPPAVPPSTAPATTTATTAVETGMPRYLVATRRDGEIAVVDSADGSVVRVLVPAGRERADAIPPAGSVALTPDGRVVYFARAGGAGSCGTIHRVPVAGGAEELVAQGVTPAVSPDGTKLAYVAHEPEAAPEGQGCRLHRLVIRDLATGAERFTTNYEPNVDTIQDVLFGTSWSPDSRYVAVEAGWENWATVFIVDSSEEQWRDHAVVSTEGGRVYNNPLYRGKLGDLVVYVEPPGSSLAEPLPGRHAVVDPRTGRIKSSYGEDVRPVAFDVTGDHMLSIDRDGALTRWTGGRAVKIGEGFVDADW